MRIIIFLFLLTVACVYAWARGGAPERTAAAVILAGVAMTGIAASPYSERFNQLEIGIFAVDLIAFVLLLGLALYAERFWTLWICAFQAIQVLSHLPMILIRDILPEAYVIIVAIWSYPMLIILIIATFRHRERITLHGVDRSWSGS